LASLKNNALASVRDSTSAQRRVINTVIGIYERNFHNIPGKNIIGRKATSVVMVPDINGDFRSRTASMTACFALYQSFCLSEAHSIITIIVSIAIPSVSTSEKFVRKLREYPRAFNTIKVMKNASGNRMLAIMDSRNHTKTNIVINTRISV
jgi:hypothetical protein